MNDTIGFIKLFSGNFPPMDWAFCNGQLLQIAENEALFSIIGTTYGGDGVQSFALPNLSGRMPVGFGQNPTTKSMYVLGQNGGTETVTLTQLQLPSHRHVYNALSGDSESDNPTNNFLSPKSGNFYSKKDTTDQLLAANAEVLSSAIGGGAAHNNLPPFIALSYIICIQGSYPIRP
jgi:microcystin-dependent protein